MDRPRVVFGQQASKGMTRGAEQLAYLAGLTLGPVAGHVLSAKNSSTEKAEVITDAATLLRRITALPGPMEDVGAMILRQLVWRVRQRAGDGSATAAVLAYALMKEGRRYMAAGVDPMVMHKGIEKAVEAAAKSLEEMAEPLEGQERMAALATAASGDVELGKIIGEIYETVGREGIITIEEFLSPYLDREYKDGSRFGADMTSRIFYTDETHHVAQLTNPYILITDHVVSDASQILPAMDLMLNQGGGRPLLIVGSKVEGEALTFMILNHDQKRLRSCAVNLKGAGDALRETAEDLAVLTGATFFPKDSPIPLEQVKLSDLGQAERIEADGYDLIIFGGVGDRKAIRQHRQMLRARFEEAQELDTQEAVRKRLGRLAGGIAVLKIGELTPEAREQRRRQAEETIKVVGAGYRKGVVPGGGVAYLACIPAVMTVQAEGDAAFGVLAVARALEEPLRRIAANAGIEPSVAIARCRNAGKGYGMDVQRQQIAEMRLAGIVDSVAVLETALEQAASGASMMLTTGAVILRKEPEQSLEP